MQKKRRLQKLLITSSVCDEGKSVITANLALTLARRPQRAHPADRSRPSPSHRQRPVLVDPTARHHRVGRRQAGARRRAVPGSDTASVDSRRRQASRRSAAPAGIGPLRQDDRYPGAVSFDWVLLTPPRCSRWPTATSLSRLSDGVLVVVREGFTRRKVLEQGSRVDREVQASGHGLQPGLDAERRLLPLLRRYNSRKKASKKEAKKEADQVKAASA